MSVKKVFAIIGIVVGCVTTFVGGVIGVMALMGKFKTPVVKPEKLYFENLEQVVIAQYKDDDGKDVIYSFNLKAENNSIDHPVNVKECFIWFEGAGENLIELCDKDGNLLKPNSKKRYAVNCNETLYFKIKVFYEEYDYNSSTWIDNCKKLFVIQQGKYVLNESEEYDDSLTYYTIQTYEEKYSLQDLQELFNSQGAYGKVALRARTVDDTVQTNQDLVIWVDRNVSSIFLNYGDIPNDTSNPNKEQRINIGVDKEVELNYVVNPEISLRPISCESKKVVELYYDDPKVDNDFVLVNIENIKNKTAYSLYKIFDEEKCYVDETTGELKLIFRSSEATNSLGHYFKLAIFPSYKARAEFLAQENLAQENGKRITNVDRLQSMVSTDLYIQVVNTNIDNATLSDGELNLNLFTKDNVVYLSNEEAEAMNLNVEMFAGGDKLNIRYDELDFKTINSSMLNANPKFNLKVNQIVDVKEINFAEYNKILYNPATKQLSLENDYRSLVCLVKSTVQVGDYLIVDSLMYENIEYLCSNGVALVYTGTDNTAKTIKMLAVDSYLDFYIYNNANQTYTLATDEDIKYSVTTDGQYADKNWNIVVENISSDISDGTKTLVLGLLVTNDEGKFNVENLFATKPVTINVQELHYTIKNSSVTLDLEALNDGFVPADAGKAFNYFVDITEGTYNTCIYLISEKEVEENIAIVDYVENLFYIDDKGTVDVSDDEKFYIVGYFDGANFVNNVRTRDNSNVTKETAENKLQMLQLKNSYGEMTSDVIARLIGDKNIELEGIQIAKEKVQKLFKTNITVKQNLVVGNSVEFNVVAKDNVTNDENPNGFYSKTSGHTITITTPSNPEIITRICNFYGIIKTDGELNSNYILNNYPENARLTGRLVDEDENKALVIILDVGELLSSDVNVEIKLANVFVINFEEMLYSFKIKNSAPKKIVYNYGGGYIELAENQVNAPVVTAEITWESGNYKEIWYYKEQPINITLNPEITGSDMLGFQDPDFKVKQGITYGISNNAITKNEINLNINSITDGTYLSVTIAGETRYLKLAVVQKGFELKQNVIEIAGDTGYLKDSVNYKYEDALGVNDIYGAAFALNDINLTNINVLYSNSETGILKIDEDAGDDDTFVFVYDIANTDDDLTILTIDNTGTDWKFTRTDDLYAALSITFKVVTKTRTLDCSLKFSSGIEYEVNARAWGEDIKLYQGTQIQLYESKIPNAYDDFEFDTEALIKIRNSAKKDIKVVSDAGYEYDEVITLSSLGEHKFIIKVVDEDGVTEEEIQTLTFTVVPNIVIKQTGDLILDSGSDDVSAGIYDKVGLYKFITSYITEEESIDIIYGKTKDAAGNRILYSTDGIVKDESLPNDKISILEASSTAVTMQSKEEKSEGVPYVKTNGSKIETAWIDLIDTMKEVNVEVMSDGYVVGTFAAIVKNNNKVVTDGLIITSDNVLNLKAMLDYDDKFLINGKTFTLSKLEWVYSDADNNGTKINESSIIPTLNKRFENVTLKLTFAGTDVYAGKTLVFNGRTINDTELTINIVPYELENSANIGEAYSENKFNLLKDVVIDGETIFGVYDTANIENYFEYIIVDSVKDENGNDLTSNLGIAYSSENLTDGLTIRFNKISEDSVKAIITYTVKYKNLEDTYTYTKEITLLNWQELSVQYPENEAEEDENKYLFIDEVTLSNGVKYENKKYEAVVIDSIDSYTIDLKDVQNKNISRITAKNRTDGSTQFTTIYSIESLEILGYENTVNLSAYVNGYGNIEIKAKDGIITFKNYSNQFSGLIVFRLTSTSGNYEDYFVRVSCLGNNTAVNGSTIKEQDAVYTDGTTISSLVNNIETDYIKTNFNNVTSFDATKVKMFLLNATVLASDNKIYVGDDVFGANTQYTCVNDKTLTINDYTTITLSLIYQDLDNGYVYPIGILKLYLRPSGSWILENLKAIDDTYKLANDNEIESGEFTYEISANSKTIDFPTDFDALEIETGKKYILDSNGNLVDFIEGIEINSNITIVNQVTSDTKFTVFYTKDNYTIKVTYTLKPVEIKAGSTHTIGELNNAKTAFVDTFVIDEDNYKQYFGTYQGQIKIENVQFNVGKGTNAFKFVDDSNNVISAASGNITTDGKIVYSISAGVLTLTFKQDLYDIVKTINVRYINLNDSTKQNQTYTFNVKRGLYIETTTGDDKGVNSAQRKTTDVVAGAYASDVGSTLSVTKAFINGTNADNGVKYAFAGYTIYVKDASGLIKFKFKEIDSPYVISDNLDFELNSNTLSFEEVIGESYTKANVNFVHMPNTNKTIDVTFTVGNGTEEFKTDASTVDTRTLYLTLAQTYLQVEAVYLTKPGESGEGADKTYYYPEAENVVSGYLIENLQNYLYTLPSGIPNGLGNPIRLKLKTVDGSYVETDFSAMGFDDDENPNFINFTLDAKSKAILTTNAENNQNIRFDNVSANEKCVVYLDNLAGMPTASYTFQIMSDTKVDGFNFSTEGHPDIKTEIDPGTNEEIKTEYMSFVIPKDDNKDVEYSTGKLKIGTIKDGLSKGVFVLNEFGVLLKFLPKAGSDNDRKVAIADGNNEYIVTLEMDPYNNSNWDIYVDYHRLDTNETLPAKTEITLNIHGTTGYILKDLKVVLFNAEVGQKNQNRQSVYGGVSFNILEDVNYPNYGIDVPDGAELELDYEASMVGESGYALTKKLSEIPVIAGKNTLIEFNATTKILTTKTVGKNVDINLVFKVRINGYYLNNVEYQIQLLRSLQFFFNGDAPEIVNGKWTTNSQTSYSTNFVLTNKNPTVTNFGADMKFSFNVRGDSETINGITYFSNLLFELEDCVGGQASSVRILKDLSKVNPDDSIVRVDNTGITFFKDYTGKLYLTLTAGLANEFNYTVSWVIDVFGILDIQPQNKTDNEGLKSSGLSYSSGQNVDLLGDATGGSTGLYLKDMKKVGETILFDAYIDYDKDASNKLTATYQYAIVKYNANDGYNNQQRFANASNANKSEENVALTITDRKSSVTLPIVPRTGSEESYLVIYKIKINYLNNKELVYYVAYSVVNNLNITVTALKHGNGDDFDVDNINVNNRLVASNGKRDTTTLSNNTYLDLFYYAETYKDASNNEYKLILTGIDTYKVSVDGGINYIDANITNISGTTDKLKLTYSGGTNIDITRITEEGKTENYMKTSTGTGASEVVTNASLFTLNFNNITEFNKFIKEDIGSINIDSEVQGIKEYAIKYAIKSIVNGRWGIDLSKWNDKSEDSTDVLFNNKLEDAKLVIVAKNSGQPICTIDKYNSQTKTGFRLHTSNELVAAESKKFNDLFVKETVTQGWLTYQYYDIIGVYGNNILTPQTCWVKSTGGGTVRVDMTTLEDVTDVTISVPIGTGSPITYTLQKVKYYADGGVDGVCKLEQYFYLLQCEYYDAVYKMNLNANSVESYEPGSDIQVVLRNYFVKYKNNDDATSENYGKLEIDESAQVATMEPITNPAQPNIEGDLSADRKIYVIKEETLIAYRNANPTSGNIVTITYKVTFGEVVDMLISINYQLPSLQGIVVNQNSLTEANSKVNITSIYVPVFDEGGYKSYSILSDQLENVTEINEKSSNYTAENGFIKDVNTEDYTGEIKLNKEKVDAYFASNGNVNVLEIKYSITTRTNNKSETMDFIILVRRGGLT